MSFLKPWIAAGLLVVVATAGRAGEAGIQPGAALPDLAPYQLDGDVPDLSGKVVLLDFWASWCAPCKASFPRFDALQQELGGQGLVILGVSVDHKASDYARFLQRHPVQFATVRDATQQLAGALAPPAMPTSFLFGRDGVLRSVHRGFHGDRSMEELTAEICQLLQEGTP